MPFNINAKKVVGLPRRCDLVEECRDTVISQALSIRKKEREREREIEREKEKGRERENPAGIQLINSDMPLRRALTPLIYCSS